jgi:hypothetical protein
MFLEAGSFELLKVCHVLDRWQIFETIFAPSNGLSRCCFLDLDDVRHFALSLRIDSDRS